MKDEQALRYNEGKVPYSYLPLDLLEDTARVLEMGAKKYARDNYRKGMPMTEVMDSLMRHYTAFATGEDNDQESGLSHIGHMICNLLFMQNIMNAEDLKDKYDDRYIVPRSNISFSK